jgi:hypothetical protein
MARIPVYQERQQVSRLRGVPELAAPSAGTEAIGGALKQVGQSLNQMAVSTNLIAQDNAKAKAAETLGRAKREQLQYLLDAENTAEPGAPNFTLNYDRQFQDYSNRILEQEQDPIARQYLAKGLLQLKDNLDSKALTFQAQESYQYKIDTTLKGINETAVAINADPFNKALFDQSIGEMKALVDSMAIPPSKRAELNRAIDNTFSNAAWQGQIAKDPEAVLRSMGTSAEGPAFDVAMEFVFNEEGDAFVEDDAGAGPTKFGINSTANPDVDVQNLSKDQAQQLYLERYWNEIGADSLPPGLAMVAMDSAVLMGPAVAKRLLRESGGDVDRYIELRKTELDRIAKIPGKEQFRNGWMARTDRLQNAANNVQLEPGEVRATGNFAFDNLPVDERIRANTQVKTLARQQQAIYQAELKGHVVDANAMALDGVSDPKPLTKDQFVRAFGAVDGIPQYMEYERNQQLATNISSMKSMPQDEIALLLQTNRPVEGEGYAASAGRYDALSRAAQQVVKQREADPMRYATVNSPGVRAAYDNYQRVLSDDNATAQDIALANQDYVRRSLAEQQRLGIVNPKVLSVEATNDLERRMLLANEDAANLTMSLEQTYGREYFPKVMGELMAAGKLPPAMMIIPDIESPAVREIIARTAKVDRSEIEAGIPSTVIRDVKDRVTTHVAQLRASAGPMGEQMIQQLSAYQETMERIALTGISEGTYTSGEAAADAAQKKLLGKYQFEGTLRMPANLDVDNVTTGLENYLDEFLPNMSIDDVPVDITGARTPEEAIEEWRATVSARHFWLADNATEGAALWAKGDNGVFYRVNSGGRQVFVPFDEAIRIREEKLTPQMQQFYEDLGLNYQDIQQRNR